MGSLRGGASFTDGQAGGEVGPEHHRQRWHDPRLNMRTVGHRPRSCRTARALITSCDIADDIVVVVMVIVVVAMVHQSHLKDRQYVSPCATP
jgi:hypothetical protein